jgi:CelD/BcsL family acetyltransferase involved in cellulose biosynthesis
LKGRERELLPRLVGLLLERLRWDRLVVDDVDAESGTCALLRDEASARRIPLLARRRYRCPWMELPGSWDAFMEIPDRVFKRIVQREGVKKLWKRHAVELSLATPESDLDANLDTLFALSRQRWQETDVTGCFEDPMVRDFYRRVSVPLTRNDWLRLSVLKVDGTPRAAEYGMAYGGAYYSLQGGCDAEGFRLRAGHVLQYKVFESLVGKVRSFQFLRGEESYKYQWGCADRRTVQLILARTPKGWSMSAARKAQDGAKRVAKAFLRRFGLRPRRA